MTVPRRGFLSGGLIGLLAGMFRPAKALADAEAAPQADAGSAPPMIAIDDPRYETFFTARLQMWSTIGTVDDDVIAYLISPQFDGAPAWPTTRQAYRTVRTAGSLIIASDGLSDLFVDTDSQEPGFGCEVYIECPDLAGADFATIRSSWQFSLIENFAQNVADLGGIDGQLARYGVLSMELPVPDNMPEPWITDRGSVGALIDIQVPERPKACQLDANTTIRVIALTILLPDEVDHVINGGNAARAEIAQKLILSGTGLMSPSNRRSVLA